MRATIPFAGSADIFPPRPRKLHLISSQGNRFIFTEMAYDLSCWYQTAAKTRYFRKTEPKSAINGGSQLENFRGGRLKARGRNEL